MALTDYPVDLQPERPFRRGPRTGVMTRVASGGVIPHYVCPGMCVHIEMFLQSFRNPIAMAQSSDPPSFACRIIAPYPKLTVADTSTPSRELFRAARVSVVHFYNGG